MLCEVVVTLMSAKQPWRVLRMAERIARDGGTDEGAVGLLAGRLARTHSVALAACLHELDPAAGGPVSITELTLAELHGVDGPPHTHKPLLKQSDDEHAVDMLEDVAEKVNAIGETCRMNVTKCDTFVYRARAVGLAARRRMTSRASRQDQARRLRETIDTGLRNLYRMARLRHADATDRRRRRRTPPPQTTAAR